MSDAPTTIVRVQEAEFDVAALQAQLLSGSNTEGAIVTFTGYVRSTNEAGAIDSMHMEHYPGMTERSISDIIDQAAQLWPLSAATVVHRVGELPGGAPIVWVGVSSAHRSAAFDAAEFIMDYLKTRAPFWKKERSSLDEKGGGKWVESHSHDADRAARWQEKTPR